MHGQKEFVVQCSIDGYWVAWIARSQLLLMFMTQTTFLLNETHISIEMVWKWRSDELWKTKTLWHHKNVNKIVRNLFIVIMWRSCKPILIPYHQPNSCHVFLPLVHLFCVFPSIFWCVTTKSSLWCFFRWLRIWSR